MSKQSVRANFRKEVFTRDGFKCRCCGKSGYDRQNDYSFHQAIIGNKKKLVPLDAHHILRREWMENGGYVKNNGISVCDNCHLKAEKFWDGSYKCEDGFYPYQLFKLVNSSAKKAVEDSIKLGER